LVFVSAGNFTRITVQDFQRNMYSVLGKNVRSAIRPFHQTKVTAEQDIFYARPYRFGFILQPVKVDVKDASAWIAVFVNNGKGRAAYDVGDALF
jgi:hypothetical protein